MKSILNRGRSGSFSHKLTQLILFLILAITLLTNHANATNDDSNVVSNIITNINNNQIDLKFELKQQPQYKMFTIANPDRLVIDFQNSKLDLKNSDFSNNKLFKSIHHAINQDGQLRIVLELNDKVQIQKSNIIKPSHGQKKYFLSVQITSDAIPINNEGNQQNYNKVTDKKTGTIKYVIKKAQELPIIIIDAGHGGKDPGTIGNYSRSKEKFITLGYAKELKKQLDKTKKFRVFLTRDSDYFIPLNGRVAKARRMKADLFISIHADSSPDQSTTGLSIYTLSEKSSDKQAAILAQKENKSDIVGGADFSDASGDILKTLINLSQRSTMNDSARFAEIAIKTLNSEGVNTLEHTHRFAGFRVLTAPDVPSVLIELGYLSNKNEEKRLNSLNHKETVAKALVEGVDQYFK